jgi:hypothetical protein
MCFSFGFQIFQIFPDSEGIALVFAQRSTPRRCENRSYDSFLLHSYDSFLLQSLRLSDPVTTKSLAVFPTDSNPYQSLIVEVLFSKVVHSALGSLLCKEGNFHTHSTQCGTSSIITWLPAVRIPNINRVVVSHGCDVHLS